MLAAPPPSRQITKSHILWFQWIELARHPPHGGQVIVTLVMSATVGPLLELLELGFWGSCSWKAPLFFTFLFWVNLKREFKKMNKIKLLWKLTYLSYSCRQYIWSPHFLSILIPAMSVAAAPGMEHTFYHVGRRKLPSWALLLMWTNSKW